MTWHLKGSRAGSPPLRAVGLGLALATAEAASVPESPDPIVIGKLDWTGQEITAEIAGEILRRMGYKVQFVQTTQVPAVPGRGRWADHRLSRELEPDLQEVLRRIQPRTAGSNRSGRPVSSGRRAGTIRTMSPRNARACRTGGRSRNAPTSSPRPTPRPRGGCSTTRRSGPPTPDAWIKAWDLDLVTVPSGGEGSTAAEVKSRRRAQGTDPRCNGGSRPGSPASTT